MRSGVETKLGYSRNKREVNKIGNYKQENKETSDEKQNKASEKVKKT